MESTRTARRFLKADLWVKWEKSETDQRKGIKPPANQKPYPKDATLVELVSPDNFSLGQMPLVEAIRKRRSRREYTDEYLSLEELSFLLWATQGVDQEATQSYREWLAGLIGRPASDIHTLLRTVPSGGACHPFETYLAVNRVRGLKPGLYRYLSVEHKLLCVDEGPAFAEKMSNLPLMLKRGAVLFIWTAVPYRSEWRYTIVAPKMIAQESGHICQNLYLACEAIRAGTCAVGAYNQEQMDDLLSVDGEDEFTIYIAPVGKVA
jgi:SagB-type dehydrogenase family enzyme